MKNTKGREENEISLGSQYTTNSNLRNIQKEKQE